MGELRVIGSEEGRLVLTDEAGERHTLAIDDVLRSEIRSNGREAKPAATGVSPREIQARIRAGLTADEVAELLSVELETVRRFETPVLAEREHIVDLALAVPVVMGSEFEVEENPTFGSAVRAKLADLGATGERWSSWKDDDGWKVKLEFTANDVDHDARWSFDPRRSALSPLNGDATQLSRQGPLPDGLIPRLRAVDLPEEADERVDSGPAGPRRLPDPAPETPEEAAESEQVRDAATHQAPAESRTSPETADLLEALRRRRGQREPAPADDDELEESTARHPAKGSSRRSAPLSLFEMVSSRGRDDDASASDDETPEEASTEDDELVSSGAQSGSDSSRRRNGRPAMPSWDEIVFGARGDD